MLIWVSVFWMIVFSLLGLAGLGFVLLIGSVLLADEIRKTLRLLRHPVRTWKGTMRRSYRPHRRLQEQGKR